MNTNHQIGSKLSSLSALMILIMVAVACNSASDKAIATPTSLHPTEVTIPTPLSALPTQSLATTQATLVSPVKLPAPLYFIDSDTKQIHRLEVDGKTSKPITFEPKPVTAYDVSPADGSLAYIADNALILTDAFGRNRKVLFAGAPADLKELTTQDYWTNILSAPRWSPDGKQIVFGLNGINIVSISGGEPQLIQPSDRVDFTDIYKYMGARTYAPVSWSPDGTRLLLEFGWIPEAGGHAIKNLNDGGLVDLERPGGMYEHPVWNINGTRIYRSDVTTIIGDGCSNQDFHVIDTNSGKLLFDIPGLDESKCEIVRGPYLAANGMLYLFMAAARMEELFKASPTVPSPVLFGMYRATPDGKDRVLLRNNIYNVWDVLWALDASGAIVVSGEKSWMRVEGSTIHWISADNSQPLITLPIKGSNFLWGQR